MTRAEAVFTKEGSSLPYALLRRIDNFGFAELDLLRPSGRFWLDGEPAPSAAELGVDARRAIAVSSAATLLETLPLDSWAAMTRRSMARLLAWFVVAEDPQRRLEVQPIATLAHQASVVQHILRQPSLRRVLLADEVGLGKTVEAGLLIRHVVTQNPGARVLYLAPARLVRNVRVELDRLGLQFRSWVATPDRDATLQDSRVVASIHRAAHEGRVDDVLAAPAWDMIVVDECHHLSAWAPGGGSPVAQYKLVEKLAERLSDAGRLVLMSGTPHQGHAARFKNILRLLHQKGDSPADLAGRVIYRTKDDVVDWEGRPLFPRRQINQPIVVDLGVEYQLWLGQILSFFEPDLDNKVETQRRAAGWRAGQALQWATSSVQAGLGYLLRQAIRARQSSRTLPALDGALEAIRPYRTGPPDEPIGTLWNRMVSEIDRQIDAADLEDLESYDDQPDDGRWRPDPRTLNALLAEGVRLLSSVGDRKWEAIWERVLKPAGNEKVVLFAQPIETVTAVAAFLKRKTGVAPAVIMGNQSEHERASQVSRFCGTGGPQFLVSSRAGGEGINLQVARRLVHLDVPWNPMDLEQRIGRVHRFKSRKTILVDTVVVKDSREVDTYAFAREKLKTIASSLVTEERFEALFGRVMALVPPEELQHVMLQGPVGPLSDDDQRRLGDLVTRGFEQWQSFHDVYSSQRKQIGALDPGAANWEDLSLLAQNHLDAKVVAGFTALGFHFAQDKEVVEAPQAAHVLDIADKSLGAPGRAYSCGDYGGMPVEGEDGIAAERLGTNTPIIARALRVLAFPEQPVGAAHLRWPEGSSRPAAGTFGVIVVARQTVRSDYGTFSEHELCLHAAIVEANGAHRALGPDEKGSVIRGLMVAKVRREADGDLSLRTAIQKAEGVLIDSLRRPTQDDRTKGLSHGVVSLLAAIVA